MTLRKDLADPADPRDRSALPLRARPGKSPPPPRPPAAADEPQDPIADEELDEDSARPLPDPQDEGRF